MERTTEIKAELFDLNNEMQVLQNKAQKLVQELQLELQKKSE